ncbi:alanine--tRNA ligase, partial [Candidatus Uhrbacteria bacterium CG_4_9_14_3_um_filter_36_7]
MIKTFLMNSQLLRQKFLDFFKEKGHTIIPSASLIPENDPTVLFTTAGMHPLVPYLLGEPHPAGKRVVDIQKCIRTGDIDEVGDNRHLTFFEMLGNWSLGDYFKKEAIEWSFEFLTSPKWLGLDPSRLYVTVFAGNHESPLDEVSIKYWQEQFKKFDINAQVSLCGVWENASTHIFALPREDNWWGLESGGPCGPCTEMFYDVAPEQGFQKGKTHQELVNNFRFFEIWNDVFMEYKRLPNGHLEKLVQKNVDTGMGLERTLAILNGRTNVFESESFQNIFELLTLESEKTYTSSEACGRAMRIIADHLRASVMIINDGVIPSNKDQGYVLRRLIRRAVRYGKCLGIKSLFLAKISKGIIEDFQKHYKELQKNTQHIYDILTQEEQKFNRTIEKGLHEFEKMYEKNSGISGEDAFILYSTYGFPLELTEEISLQKGQKINRELFE